MTIAACYLSPEGVVLGADSTSTYTLTNGMHHFNFGQKLFEIGQNSTLGIVTWGLGGLSIGSYRTLIARFSDALEAAPPADVKQVADRWSAFFWERYSLALAEEIERVHKVLQKKEAASADERLEVLDVVDRLTVGFCIGGYVRNERVPEAYEIIFEPVFGPPIPTKLPPAQSFWGVPALISRLIKGCADEVIDAILASGKWSGTAEELDDLVSQSRLVHPSTVPIRDAIDFTHACLLTTVKAMKFSPFPQVCGGPIEIGVITTDRPFRWVQHKRWDAAIVESNP